MISFRHAKGQKTGRRQHSSQICTSCLQFLAKLQPGKRHQLQTWKQFQEVTSKGFGHQNNQGVNEEPLTVTAGVQVRELGIPS